MYTDETAADSSSTVGGSSSDEDERSNQQVLTARGRSESQGQLSDQDTDLDRSSYFVLSDPTYTYEAVPAFTPDVNRTTSNNKKFYGKPMSVGEVRARIVGVSVGVTMAQFRRMLRRWRDFNGTRGSLTFTPSSQYANLHATGWVCELLEFCGVV
ncbi:hypothetical protein PR001_g18838 [Phytophthora rubi]|uniref:Uncharacterized protein n=1 Tax=Phytophthora rubi TaxID=129364 RepID=A0A6A3K3R1_9STRA|nr:hypothetical protein PR001_g18838 [Phytophthora rubi]